MSTVTHKGQTEIVERADVAYTVRAQTVVDDAHISAAVRRGGGRNVGPMETRAMLRRGIEQIFEDDEAEAARLTGICEEFWLASDPVDEAQFQESGATAQEEAIAKEQERRAEVIAGLEETYSEISDSVERHFPPFGDLISSAILFNQLWPIEKVRRCLVKVEGLDDLGKINKKKGLSDTQLTVIGGHDPDAIAVLSGKAWQLSRPSGEQEKN